MPSTYPMIATAAFGLEGIVAGELRRLGLQNVRAENGGARFDATAEQIFLCNLRLRCADRVLMILAEKPCRTFDELFRLVESIPWERYLSVSGRFLVSGKCARSQLMSVRDCQAITKKALIERMKRGTGAKAFPETGEDYRVDVSLHADMARITLDTSGTALNRRGYRTWNGEAPLRETLAAALVELSPWRPGMRLHDPCCGTGTLLIEAAWRAAHRAPGLTRSFDCERFGFLPAASMRELRRAAEADVDLGRVGEITGTDIDPEALTLAGRHIRQAGLEGCVRVEQGALERLTLEGEPGVFLCNPPYGERLGEKKQCEALYREMGQLLRRHAGWSLCAITSDPMFERCFGRRADKKRRLYNGRLECEFMIFQPKS